MSDADVNMIEETMDCIAYMRQHHPDHPLSAAENLNSQGHCFEWATTWTDIDRIAHKAQAYRDNVESAIASFGRDDREADPPIEESLPNQETNATDDDPWDIEFDLEVDTVLHPRRAVVYAEDATDDLRNMFKDYLTSANIHPQDPLTLPSGLMIQSSLQPLLKAQHRLLTSTTLVSILRVHRLFHHLSILHTFHFFGSGTFATSRRPSIARDLKMDPIS